MRSIVPIHALTLMLSLVAPHAALAAEPLAKATASAPAIGKLTAADLKALIDHKEVLYVYDANERDSYLAGHVPGAQWIAYDAVTAAKLPPSQDAKLVFYCYNPQCGASPIAAKAAQALGFRNVWLMPEGITGWRTAHLAIVSGAHPN